MRIDIWSDIACPWCYIGLTRFDRVLKGFPHADDVTVRLRSFQLDPTLPDAFDGTGAEYLARSKRMPEEQVRQMFSHVAEAAAAEGLTLDPGTVRVANSRKAHRLLHAAQGADPTGRLTWALKTSLFAAHFADGDSISDPDTLVRRAVEVGLDAEVARSALGSDALDDEVADDIQQAAAYGISGVPFFVLAEKYGISGAQPAEAFEEALGQVWNELNPAPAPAPLTRLALPGAADAEACGPAGCD